MDWSSKLVDDYNLCGRFTTPRAADGDGVADRFEGREWTMPSGPATTFETSPTEADSDGDGLREGREVQFVASSVGVERRYTPLVTANPASVDTDGDGLSDATEAGNWTVNVTREDGTAVRWNPDGSPTTVTSDPTQRDTDDDGLSDAVERNSTHTDPEARVTYEVTRRHQRYVDAMAAGGTLVDEIQLRGNRRLAKKIGLVRGGQRLRDVRLTDASDDFDFLLVNGSSPRERTVFTALDGNERTDRWLDSEEEVANGTDPWDPDTDDDGLTDGQEIVGLTIDTRPERLDFLKDDTALNFGTNATDPDSDDDGYWDGWIGVYGVNRTENVVLYRENFQNTHGAVADDQIVQEQLGYHRPTDDGPRTSHMSAELPRKGNGQFHSNTHIGELQWGKNPTSSSAGDVPRPGVVVELDYHAETPQLIRNETWRTQISRNFALYGINVTFDTRQTDVFTTKEEAGGVARPFYTSDVLSMWNSSENHQTNNLYMVVVPALGDISGLGLRKPEDFEAETRYTSVMYGSAASQAGNVKPERFDWNRNETVKEVTEYVAVHELGHHLGMGEADDDGDEVYSGDSDPSGDGPFSIETDQTLEYAHDRGGEEILQWSAMSGANPNIFIRPTNRSYVAFSIEELTTVEERPGVCNPGEQSC